MLGEGNADIDAVGASHALDCGIDLDRIPEAPKARSHGFLVLPPVTPFGERVAAVGHGLPASLLGAPPTDPSPDLDTVG